MISNCRRLKKLLISLCVSVTSAGCGTVKVYDREVCGDLGSAGARCTHTLVDKVRDVPKAQWDRERVGMLCMSSQAYSDAESAVEQLCAVYQCDYQTRESLRAAFSRVRKLKNKGAHLE